MKQEPAASITDDPIAGGEPAREQQARESTSGSGGHFGLLLLAVGLVLVALNLRISVVSIGPVLSDIRADLGLSAAAASLLTTIPVLAFGVFAFAAPTLIRRLGLHRLIGLAISTLALGTVFRSVPSSMTLFLGTVVIGAAIAIGNVVMPAAIKRDFSGRAGLMMGLYTTALYIGAAAAAGLTVPLTSAVGSWRIALAIWAIPALVAFIVWLPQLRRSPVVARPVGNVAATSSVHGEPAFRALLRDPVALSVTALMGLQSLSYYAALTWVPTILTDAGMSASGAGWMLSFSAFPGIPAALVAPAFAKRTRITWLPVTISVVLIAAAYVGLALAPTPGGSAYLWMALLGMGQGASISLALTYIVLRSPDAHHAGHVSTMAQGCGYLVACLGPVAVGALHSLSGGWTVPLMALTGLLVLQLGAGVFASRDRHVLARG